MGRGDAVDQLRAAFANAAGGQIGLCLVRLDQLPQINARVGYECGELVLEEFAHRVHEFAAGKDVVVAIENHKLAVALCRVTDRNHAELAVAKLMRMFKAPVEVLDESLKVGLHVGVCVGERAGADVTEFLSAAEAALDEARTRRSPCVFSGAERAEDVAADWTRLRDVEGAFERGELVLYYQPKVHASYGSVLGAEGLMRWESPERGLVMPGEFIPVVERSELIEPLSWFALKSAIAQCRDWPEPLSVAVNIAPSLLNSDEIVRVTSDALAIFALAPHRLTLEVTETGFMEQPEVAFGVLGELRELGVRIAIDDFGTGYSSLSYFRDLPADELKIDRSFVANMARSRGDADIVKAIIDLAHNFSLKVVAEGVEDEQTARALCDLGCDCLQGYWFAKPMPAREYSKWLARKLGA